VETTGPWPASVPVVCLRGHENCTLTHQKGRPRKGTAGVGTRGKLVGVMPAPTTPVAPDPIRVGLAAFVVDDGEVLDPDDLPDLLACYQTNRCSMVKTARALGLSLGTLRRWRKNDKALAEALATLDEMLVDEVRDLYVAKALDPATRNPAYAIFFLKKNDPRYADAKDKRDGRVEIVIKDKTFERKS
jgi:hypothetical protein